MSRTSRGVVALVAALLGFVAALAAASFVSAIQTSSFPDTASATSTVLRIEVVILAVAGASVHVLR